MPGSFFGGNWNNNSTNGKYSNASTMYNAIKQSIAKAFSTSVDIHGKLKGPQQMDTKVKNGWYDNRRKGRSHHFTNDKNDSIQIGGKKWEIGAYNDRFK